MTDGSKKHSDMLDKTLPMPVPRGTRPPTTGEHEQEQEQEQEPATDPAAQRLTLSRTRDTLLPGSAAPDGAPAVSSEGPRSFDDEVEHNQIAPRAVPPRSRAPEAIEPVASPIATAPVADAADADSIVTAPIPMISGMNARDLRDDEPSLPSPRVPATTTENETSPSRPAALASDFPSGQHIDSELVGLVIGDGFERPARSAPAPSVDQAIFDQTVEHTPAFVRQATELVSRDPPPSATGGGPSSDQLSKVEGDDTGVSASLPDRPRRPLRRAAALGGAAGLVVVAVVVLALRVPEREAPAELAPTITATLPVTTTTPVNAVAMTPPPARAPVAAPVVAVTPTPATATLDAATSTPPSTASARATRRRDGFGPFLNLSSSDAPGLSQALDRGLRAALGDSAFTTGPWMGLGVRGEVRRAQAKGKPLLASVDCGLTIIDERSARASLSATATALDAGAGREPALRSAAERCARSLAGDVRAALDQLRR